MQEVIMSKVTNGLAVVGVVTPLWWPILQEVSFYAAAILPIVSLGWIGYQLIRRIYRDIKGDE